jgi:hypothetical protein
VALTRARELKEAEGRPRAYNVDPAARFLPWCMMRSISDHQSCIGLPAGWEATGGAASQVWREAGCTFDRWALAGPVGVRGAHGTFGTRRLFAGKRETRKPMAFNTPRDRRPNPNDPPRVSAPSRYGMWMPLLLAAAIVLGVVALVSHQSPTTTIGDTNTGPSVKTVEPMPSPSPSPAVPTPNPTTEPPTTPPPAQ